MENFRGIIYAVLSAITFGMIPLFAIPVMQNGDLNTFSVLLYRFFFATIIMVSVGLITKRNFRIKPKEMLTLMLFGLNYIVTALILLYAYNFVPSGVATTVHSLYPIFITIFSVLVFKERIKFIYVVSIVASFIGVVMMNWSGGASNIKGLAMVFFTVFTYCNYIIIMSKSDVRHLDPVVLNSYILFFGGALMLLASLFIPSLSIQIPTATGDIVNLVLLALVATAASNIFLIMAVKLVGAAKTSTVGAFEPATAVIVGVLCFNEHIDWLGISGFMLIILSTIAVVITSAKADK